MFHSDANIPYLFLPHVDDQSLTSNISVMITEPMCAIRHMSPLTDISATLYILSQLPYMNIKTLRLVWPHLSMQAISAYSHRELLT